MPEIWVVILLHQFVFQGMFFLKNIVLHRKIGEQIRGKNVEATISISFFAFFIVTSLVLGFIQHPSGKVQVISETTAVIVGMVLLILNLAISAASLLNLKDSWRVGVLEDQKTELVTAGIYRYTRNPYFVSYFLMFAAYTVLLQNVLLLVLSTIGFVLVHKMILKEEKYLYSVHGDAYVQYKSKVSRYMFI